MIDAGSWQAWLEEISKSDLASKAMLDSWRRSIDALDTATDAHARRLIERQLANAAVLWQVATAMHAENGAAQHAPPVPGLPVGPAAGAVMAQLCAAAIDARATPGSANVTDPRAVAHAQRLGAMLSGVALGALAAHREAVSDARPGDPDTFSPGFPGASQAPSTHAERMSATLPGGGGALAQLRRLAGALEAGYAAHAISDAFASEMAGAFDAWLAADLAFQDT